ncbi:uncharacterized protein LOC143036627 [Oratosquilla oratoria]|uniref:uncharacterized protein LOC143036627 n=1 Tax=Oratosquilla oratoria TaxID=337810 RepID=UPI003F75C6A3
MFFLALLLTGFAVGFCQQAYVPNTNPVNTGHQLEGSLVINYVVEIVMEWIETYEVHDSLGRSAFSLLDNHFDAKLFCLSNLLRLTNCRRNCFEVETKSFCNIFCLGWVATRCFNE